MFDSGFSLFGGLRTSGECKPELTSLCWPGVSSQSTEDSSLSSRENTIFFSFDLGFGFLDSFPQVLERFLRFLLRGLFYLSKSLVFLIGEHSSGGHPESSSFGWVRLFSDFWFLLRSLDPSKSVRGRIWSPTVDGDVWVTWSWEADVSLFEKPLPWAHVF